MTFDPASLIGLLHREALASRLWHPQTKAPGTRLFEQGALATHGWVLTSGLVKLGYVTTDGREWIKSFVADQGLFAGASDISASEPNRYGAVCLEESVLVALPVKWLGQRISGNAELQSAFVAFALWLQQRKQEREETLLCMSAEQRYRAFVDEPSSLANRLTQNDIARYIGVTAIALSRIRKRQPPPLAKWWT
jgi:CRP/FNR family transcriptional regulator, anaerobic regulatory protein